MSRKIIWDGLGFGRCGVHALGETGQLRTCQDYNWYAPWAVTPPYEKRLVIVLGGRVLSGVIQPRAPNRLTVASRVEGIAPGLARGASR